MEINIDKQKDAQQKAKELLASEEQKRAEQRLIKLVANLEVGYREVLLNDAIMEKIPTLISDYCQNGDSDEAGIFFDKLGECACSEERNVRERAVMALSLCLSGLESMEHDAVLVKQVNSILLRWLRVETDYLSVCNVVCSQLKDNGLLMMEEGMWKECSILLEVLFQIQSGSLKKNNAIRSVVCKAQDGIAQDYILEELTLVSLRGRGKRRLLAESLLTHLGRLAADHLLDTLLNCQKKEDRLRLVSFIPATGNASVSILKECLQKKLPWYGYRNIILMITAMDDENLIPLVMPLVSHEDIRIQQQVLDCITEVATENLGGYLLAALPLVDDSLKVGLVPYIGKLGESEGCNVFLDLLTTRNSFSPGIHDELLRKLVIQIRLSNSIRAVNLLNLISEERRNEYDDPRTDPVLQAVQQSLHILKPRFTHNEESRPALQMEESVVDEHVVDEHVSFAGDSIHKGAAQRKVHAVNEKVAEYLGNRQVSEASQYLYEKCIAAAEEKDFATAELLRDRILEVDPNALAEVIQAGEKIEEEQSSSITTSHITIWQDLYDSLSTEEFNALYYALESREFSSGSVVVEQGAICPELYFINSGEARLTCWRDKEEIFLKRLGAGVILGAGPFFDVSVWTVSLTAVGPTNIHVLQREKYLELLEQYPVLEPCLREHCNKTDVVPELLKMSGEDRRRSARYPLALIVHHSLLDKFGKASNRSFKGEINDLSSNGLSFCIRISRKENARLMLGRGIETRLAIPDGQAIETVGQIVAVRFQPFGESEYSVHVQFNDPLADDVVKAIALK